MNNKVFSDIGFGCIALICVPFVRKMFEHKSHLDHRSKYSMT